MAVSAARDFVYLESRKMNHAINGGVFGEDMVEGLLIGDVDIVEDGAAAAELLNAVKGDLGGIIKVVDDDDIVAVLEQRQAGERANVAGTTAGCVEQVQVSWPVLDVRRIPWHQGVNHTVPRDCDLTMAMCFSEYSAEANIGVSGLWGLTR